MNRLSCALIFSGTVGAAVYGGYFWGRATTTEPSPPTPWIDIATDSGTRFPLSKVIKETCGVDVIPLDLEDPTHRSIRQAVLAASTGISEELSREGSPAHEKRRINEVSSLFENALREKIDALPEFSCQIPQTSEGKLQRSGYPDLQIEHLPSGTTAYLDPKLYEHDSLRSTLRTFYYEASRSNTKVTKDAIHLLLGFPHDGQSSRWKFGPAQLVDLSEISLKLKVEFSASNKELYPNQEK